MQPRAPARFLKRAGKKGIGTARFFLPPPFSTLEFALPGFSVLGGKNVSLLTQITKIVKR